MCCIWINVCFIGPDVLCFVSFLVIDMISMYTVQWHLSAKIAWDGSPSPWTGQIDSFVQTLQVDLVLERTRCKCFCHASTVVPSAMGRTITEYGEETRCYGWRIDWTTRHNINFDPCFFFFFFLLFLFSCLYLYIWFSFSFFFFNSQFQPSVCIVWVSLVHWLWKSIELDIAGQLSLSSPPILSSSPSRFGVRRFLNDALAQSLDKRCLLYPFSKLDFHGSPRWSWNDVLIQRPSCWALTPAFDNKTAETTTWQPANHNHSSIGDAIGYIRSVSVTFIFSCVNFAGINLDSVPCRRRF